MTEQAAHEKILARLFERPADWNELLERVRGDFATPDGPTIEVGLRVGEFFRRMEEEHAIEEIRGGGLQSTLTFQLTSDKKRKMEAFRRRGQAASPP